MRVSFAPSSRPRRGGRASECRVGAYGCLLPPFPQPISVSGRVRRLRAGALGPRNSPSSPGDLMPCFLVASTAFLPRFLTMTFLFTPRPLCTVSGALIVPGPRFVRILTPLALASCWVSLVRVLYEHGNEGPFWLCSPLPFLWPVLLLLQTLGILSMVVPFPSACPSAKRRPVLPCTLWDGECCWGAGLDAGTLHLDDRCQSSEG